MNRRTFLLGAAALPIAGKVAAFEALAPAPVMEIEFLPPPTISVELLDLIEHAKDALRYGMGVYRINEVGRAEHVPLHRFRYDYRNAVS